MENQTIKLTGYEVDIKKSFTWGDKEQIQAIIVEGAKIVGEGISGMGGSDLMKAKMKALQLAIIEIRSTQKINDESKRFTIIPFSEDWMNNLSVEDGDLLYSNVDKLAQFKKK